MRKTHRLRTLTHSLLAITILSGCSWLADVSSTMRVDTGLEPENIDKNVRFRTTYYFRVLTGCRITEADAQEHASDSAFAKRISGTFVPLNDSLYRFRMTGQAAALFNKVHFESGVLRKEQIDSFGSSIRYDEKAHAYTLTTLDEAKTSALRDIEQFRTLYKDIKDDQTLTDSHRNQLLENLIVMIESRLEQVKGLRPQNTPPTSPNPGSTSTATLTKLEKQLDNTEKKLGEAKTQLENAKSVLKTAEDKVAEINAKLSAAKDAITNHTPITEEAKTQVDMLKTELSKAQEALTAAQNNRKAAEDLVTTLTEDTKKTKGEITTLHRQLTATKGSAVTALKDLATKVDDLLTALGAAKATTQPHHSEACSGKPSENKYYLLGPEGAKELDPNDRLLLALSVDSKPLISAMQKLSERKMQVASTNLKTVEELLEERGRILDTKTLLHKATTDAGKATGPTDQSDLKTLLNALRKPYVTETTSTPAK